MKLNSQVIKFISYYITIIIEVIEEIKYNKNLAALNLGSLSTETKR